MQNEIRFIELFGGIGGFRKGLQEASNKFNCVWYNEWDKYSVQTYNKNFGENYEPRDITTIHTEEIPDHDLLTAGFPCQSFSIAGKRKGFDDTRGTMFFEIVRIAKAKRPKMLLLENVKGLLNHEKGETFRTILQTLDELGYDVQWQVLNSKFFGVPQNRERVFIIGHLRGASRPEVLSFRTSSEINDKVQSKQNKEKARSSCLNTRYGQRWTDETYIKSRPHGFNKGGEREFVNVRESAIHNEFVNGIRRLTPMECERLQGFPDNWTDGVSNTQRYKQLGNAVTINVIKAIGEKLLHENTQ